VEDCDIVFASAVVVVVVVVVEAAIIFLSGGACPLALKFSFTESAPPPAAPLREKEGGRIDDGWFCGENFPSIFTIDWETKVAARVVAAAGPR